MKIIKLFEDILNKNKLINKKIGYKAVGKILNLTNHESKMIYNHIRNKNNK